MRHENARVSDPNSFVSHSGEKFRVLYDSFRNEDGTISLKAASKKDIKAEINSHAAETDMAVIVQKLMMGDSSVLSVKKPLFGDFTQFPTTYAEAFDLVNRSEKAFESLSPDIKQKFDNDCAKWFSSIGSQEWLDIMGISPESPAPPDVSPDVAKEKEVIE